MEILDFIMNAQGAYDLGSLIKLFMIMIGMDGICMMIYSLMFGSSH